MAPQRKRPGSPSVLEELAALDRQEADLAARRRELKERRVTEIGKAFEAAGLLGINDAQLSRIIDAAKDLLKQVPAP